jgi:hypothetical protein
MINSILSAAEFAGLAVDTVFTRAVLFAWTSVLQQHVNIDGFNLDARDTRGLS